MLKVAFLISDEGYIIVRQREIIRYLLKNVKNITNKSFYIKKIICTQRNIWNKNRICRHI